MLSQDAAGAEEALLEGMLDLRCRADKPVLQAVLADAAKTGACTAQSVAVFHAANGVAKADNHNPNATQAEADHAVQALRGSIDGLEIGGISTPNTTVKRDKTAAFSGSIAKMGETVPLTAVVFLLPGSGFFLRRKNRSKRPVANACTFGKEKPN